LSLDFNSIIQEAFSGSWQRDTLIVLLLIWLVSCILKLLIIGATFLFQNVIYKIMCFFLPNKYVARPRDNFTFAERRYVKQLCWSRCPRCILKARRIIPRKATQVDHLWPARLGGPGMKWNAVPLCAQCNGIGEKSDSLELWAIIMVFSPKIIRKIKFILYKIFKYDW